MAKQAFFVQCLMTKKTSLGFSQHVAWIPEKFAKVGRWLKLKIDGVWVNHWRVKETWGRKKADAVIEDSQDHKHQREASDI